MGPRTKAFFSLICVNLSFEISCWNLPSQCLAVHFSSRCVYVFGLSTQLQEDWQHVRTGSCVVAVLTSLAIEPQSSGLHPSLWVTDRAFRSQHVFIFSSARGKHVKTTDRESVEILCLFALWPAVLRPTKDCPTLYHSFRHIKDTIGVKFLFHVLSCIQFMRGCNLTAAPMWYAGGSTYTASIWLLESV